MIFEYDLLDNDQLYYVNKLFGHLEFVDGTRSNPLMGVRGEKKCLTSYTGGINTQLQDYISPIIDSKIGRDLCLTDASQILYSKFSRGSYYKWHIDSIPILGLIPHYSMSCVLNDDFDGGELEMMVGNVKHSFKLSPGKAIIYPTEYLHQVTEVTKGVRNVFCLWLRSAISDEFSRKQYINIVKTIEAVTNGEDRELILRRLKMLRNSVMQQET